MQIIIQAEDWENELNWNRAFENYQFPEFADRAVNVVVDMPEVQKFVNFFLNSNVSGRVTVTPPAEHIEWVNYAGLFSGCKNLNGQPIIDNTKNKSMAAMFKSCENIRFSLWDIETPNVVDYRQCFWGAKNYSGNGVQGWDFSSARSPDAFGNFFGGGSGMRTIYYDQFIESLHKQMEAGTLPTPMSPVDMGNSYYSPIVKEKREKLIAYGWNIVDAGEVPHELSPLEAYFSETVDSRIADGNFPLAADYKNIGFIDFGPICVGPRNGILITPRHLMHVRHYMPTVGQEMPLMSGEKVVVEKVQSGFMGLDIGIATLKEAAVTRPALVLPENWIEWMPLLNGPPTHYPTGVAPAAIRFKRGGKPTVNDISFISNGQTPSALCRMPAKESRMALYEGIHVGDSGSAVCFVYEDRLVYAYSLTSSDGSGIALSGDLRKIIEEKVNKDGFKLEDCPVRPPITPL